MLNPRLQQAFHHIETRVSCLQSRKEAGIQETHPNILSSNWYWRTDSRLQYFPLRHQSPVVARPPKTLILKWAGLFRYQTGVFPPGCKRQESPPCRIDAQPPM